MLNKHLCAIITTAGLLYLLVGCATDAQPDVDPVGTWHMSLTFAPGGAATCGLTTDDYVRTVKPSDDGNLVDEFTGGPTGYTLFGAPGGNAVTGYLGCDAQTCRVNFSESDGTVAMSGGFVLYPDGHITGNGLLVISSSGSVQCSQEWIVTTGRKLASGV